jgi:hypothetical protein
MGLLKGDLKKVPKDMSIEGCYRRIYHWHKRNGKKRMKYEQHKDAHTERYFKLLDGLPEPETASKADMNSVFCEVIYGLMEWSFHQEDEYGIKIAAYAIFARDQMKESEKRQIHRMNNVDPDAPPEETVIEDVSLENLLQLTEIVFADVTVTEQIGGRSLLFSFCLERNLHMLQATKGDFKFYNASALGLKYIIEPDTLTDHIAKGSVRILEAIAEPADGGEAANES